MSKLNEIEKLNPFLAQKIWGTKELTSIKSATNTGELPIGESLEVSCLKKQSSKLLSGIGLDEVISEDELPYLVKIIDTSDNLSIQVHPDDDYASKVENALGKTECWLILDAKEGAGIFLGLKEGVNKSLLNESIVESKDVSQLLNFYPVKRGDFFYVPAGSIHAIGKGIRLLEVQQSSGVTYRVWDWNRLDNKGNSRELHIKKALDVINFGPEKNTCDYFLSKPDVFNMTGSKTIANHRDFIFKLHKLDHSKEIILDGDLNRYAAIIALEGSLVIKRNSTQVKLDKYESVLIDKSSKADITIISDELSYFGHIY